MKKFLENRIGQPISNEEFREINEMTKYDIAFNFGNFGKEATYNDVIVIAERCAIALKRCSQA